MSGLVLFVVVMIGVFCLIDFPAAARDTRAITRNRR